MNPFPLVIGELRRSTAGTLAIVLLIALAVALGLALVVQERALRAAATRAADRFDLVVGAQGSPTQLVLTTIYLQHAPLDLLPAGTLQRIAALPGVASVDPVIVSDSFAGYTVVGTTASFAGAAGLREGRMFVTPHEAVVGAEVALPLSTVLRPAHGSPAENVLESHEHAFDATVVGRLAATGTPWDRAIIAPVESILAMHGIADLAQARLPAIVVKPQTMTAAYRLHAQLRGDGLLAVFPAEVLLPLYRLLGDARELFGWMALAYQGLVLAAVLLVIAAALSARRQSLGVLRALGAPPAYVFATVWLQGFLLIAFGIAAGVALGFLLCAALAALVTAKTGLAVAPAVGWPEARLLASLLAIGSVLSALPSLLALRLSAARLLRAA